MRAKLATFGMAVVVVVALVFEVSTVTFAEQENANMAAPAKTKKRRARKPGQKMRMAGVPMGVDNCLNHLAQMAAADPLIDYEGHPSEIINNGLLWSDPKSKCSVTDQAQREKIFELSTAWRTKDAAKVRSLLQEMGASAGGGTGAQSDAGTPAEQPAASPRKPRRSRKPAAATPAETTGAEPQAAPQTETPAMENANRPMRRPRRPARNRNAGTANSNSGF